MRKIFGNFDKNVNFGSKLHFLAQNRLKTHMGCGVVRKLTTRLIYNHYQAGGLGPGSRVDNIILCRIVGVPEIVEKTHFFIFFIKLIDHLCLEAELTKKKKNNSRVDNIILCRIV